MTTSPEFVEVALDIGRRIAREAIWHKGRCNWIGARPGLVAGSDYQAALDPWLYEGTSGVGLFLAELHGVTGEPAVRGAALGAIRHALEATRSAEAGPGLYVGVGGSALAAACAGELLGEPSLISDAHRLAQRVAVSRVVDDADRDLMHGAAGSIVSLLAIGRQVGDAGLVQAATAVGDELVKPHHDGPALLLRSSTTRRSLTGMAHGAAGIGFALLQLFGAEGDRRFADAAVEAFNYEWEVFDHGTGNWPDLRGSSERWSSAGRSSMSAWCHGGPGIALSRLTALEQLGDARWRTEAEIGLRLARDTITRYLRHGGSDFSLCHGIAGNADILLDAVQVLGGPWATARDVVLSIAAEGKARYAASATWPCGTGCRGSPGLMLGLSGIGRFYLRAAGCGIPSVLGITSLASPYRIGEDGGVDQGRDHGRSRRTW